MIPQLKLIDFGKMRDGPSAEFAMADNVKEAAGVSTYESIASFKGSYGYR